MENYLCARTSLFLATIVTGNLVGNLLLRVGLRLGTSSPSVNIIGRLIHPSVILGVLLLVVAVAAQLALLSWADLSYVNPVTAIGYVLSALAGWLFLHEQLSATRWAAIILIGSGVMLVGRTPARTVSAKPEAGR